MKTLRPGSEYDASRRRMATQHNARIEIHSIFASLALRRPRVAYLRHILNRALVDNIVDVGYRLLTLSYLCVPWGWLKHVVETSASCTLNGIVHKELTLLFVPLLPFWLWFCVFFLVDQQWLLWFACVPSSSPCQHCPEPDLDSSPHCPHLCCPWSSISALSGHISCGWIL